MPEKKTNKVPQEPGLYFAKNGGYKWFNLIVCVDYGDNQLLGIEYSLCRSGKEFSLSSRISIVEWGPKINEP